jgi:beta-lactamase superfamily II metal-dependent hydrolase
MARPIGRPPAPAKQGLRARPKGVAVYFADVGQGDCTIVVTAAQHAALVVDCTDLPQALDILEGAGSPDLTVLVSHWHRDHVAGVAGLLQNYQGKIRGLHCNLFPQLRHDSETVGASHVHSHTVYWMVKAATDRDAGLVGARAGDTLLAGDGARATAIYPTDGELGEAIKKQDLNEACVLVEVRYGTSAVLLGADLPAHQWLRLADEGRLSPAVAIKVPHHGVRSPRDFAHALAAVVAPDVAVVSVGTTNTYGHPDKDCLRQWAAVSRVMCTEVTESCSPGALPDREDVLSRLKSVPFQSATGGCPCAGTVLVELRPNGYAVHPPLGEHRRVMALFSSPQCRQEAPE